MAINLLDLVKGQLSSAVIGQAAKMIGGSNAATGKALDGIMPTLLGGMMKKSSTQSGANALFNMIKDDNHDGGILDNMTDLFSGGESTRNATQSGEGILNSLFGSGLGSIVGKVASLSGLQRGGASSLMSMAAPILMGLIGKQVKSQGLNASGLASLMSSQKDFVASAMPSGMGDELGLGSLLGGVKDAGKATVGAVKDAGGKAVEVAGDTAKAGMGFLKWLLPLLLVVALGAFLLSRMGCDNDVVNTVNDTTNSVVDGTKNAAGTVVEGTKDLAEGAKDLAKDGIDAVAGFGSKVVDGVKSFTLPGGGSVSFKEGSFGDKFTSFLGVKSTKVGERFTFDNLTFATGSANLDAASLKEVAELAKVMKAFPTVHINVEGHTDSSGDAAKNKALSLSRANAVKKQLTASGINEKRMTTAGLGSDKPIMENGAENKEKSRRIEVVVTKR